MQLVHVYLNFPGTTEEAFRFGMCVDPFGVQWMVSLPGPA